MNRVNIRTLRTTTVCTAAALCMPGCSSSIEDEASLAVVTTIEIRQPAVAGVLPPLFWNIHSYTEIISEHDYPVDVYFPDPAELNGNRAVLPTILLLQEGNVDKAHYQPFACRVASYGFVVVVPNHPAFFGTYGKVKSVNDVLAFVQASNQDMDSPLAGIVDTETLLVVGHGFGGAVALQAVQDKCEFPFCCCFRTFERPDELRGAVVYGSDLKNIYTENINLVDGVVFEGRPVPAVENQGIPVAMIHGTLDGIAARDAVEETFDQIVDSPKALITVSGVNHYSITDVNTPEGIVADGHEPELDQESAIEVLACWHAVLLRTMAWDDAQAWAYLQNGGVEHDGGAIVDVDLR